jgi:hypothetical protein
MMTAQSLQYRRRIHLLSMPFPFTVVGIISGVVSNNGVVYFHCPAEMKNAQNLNYYDHSKTPRRCQNIHSVIDWYKYYQKTSRKINSKQLINQVRFHISNNYHLDSVFGVACSLL